MQFPKDETSRPSQGQNYRQLVEAVSKFNSFAPGLPKLWKRLWTVAKLVLPSGSSKLEDAAKTASKSYAEAERLWASVEKNLGVVGRALKRHGGLEWGPPAPSFERTWNYDTLNKLRKDIPSLRDELEKYIKAMERCEETVKNKPEVEKFWADLGQTEIALDTVEEKLRLMHAEALKQWPRPR